MDPRRNINFINQCSHLFGPWNHAWVQILPSKFVALTCRHHLCVLTVSEPQCKLLSTNKVAQFHSFLEPRPQYKLPHRLHIVNMPRILWSCKPHNLHDKAIYANSYTEALPLAGETCENVHNWLLLLLLLCRHLLAGSHGFEDNLF